jgi:riboflavin synthase
MFTGLIEEVGRVADIRRVPGGARLRVEAKAAMEGTRAGDSIAVSGACLTVEKIAPGSFTAALSGETVGRTTLGGMRAGDAVNLERALVFGGRLGGHLVAGHVEAVGKVASLRPAGKGSVLAVSVPDAFLPWVVGKGSVAVDGVSLTVAERTRDGFTVAVIPETMARTTLRLKRPGDSVNLEPDLLFKYLKSLLENRFPAEGDPLLDERLRKAGFRVD